MEQAFAIQAKVGFPASFARRLPWGFGRRYRLQPWRICRDLWAWFWLIAHSPTIDWWKLNRLERVRDGSCPWQKDNCIIVCSIENFDPMGVHTGDSITVAPAQTLTDKEYQIMRNASLAVLREIGVRPVVQTYNLVLTQNRSYGRHRDEPTCQPFIRLGI